MPTLGVTFTGDSKPLLAEMGNVKARIRANLQKDLAAWSVTGVAPDPGKLFVSGNQAGQSWFSGFLHRMKGTGSGGVSQLVSVVSNTLSSLGSGMSPARILAQQGPNIVQAFHSIGLMAFGTIVAAAATASLIIYARFRGMRDTMRALSFQFDGQMDVVPRLERTQSLIENTLRKIQSAGQSMAEAYDSAAAKAERLARTTKDQFDHQRRILDLQKDRELITAYTPEQKAAVESRHAERLLALRRQEMDLQQRQAGQLLANLQAEEGAKLKQATDLKSSRGGTLLSDADAKARIDFLTKRAEAAEKYLANKDLLPLFQRQATIEFGGWTAGRADRVATLEIFAGGERDAAQRAIDIARQEREDYAADEPLRKRRQELEQQAIEARKKRVQTELEMVERERTNPLELQRLDAENAARLRNLRLSGGGAASVPGDLTANQRIGAYAMSPQVREDSRNLAAIAQSTAESVAQLRTIAQSTEGLGDIY